MNGKIRILGHTGLALFLACTLALAVVPAAKVEAATEVTDVWVEFPDADDQNEISDTDNVYLIHFKPTTALSRGVDTVTVTFPDGSTTMSGTASTAYAFTLASTMSASEVSFTTSYLITGTSWTTCTATPTVGGYRAKVTTPMDIAAGTGVWVKFASDDITSAATAGNSYKVYISTGQDTTPVLSTAFSLDSTTPGVPTTTVSPATAGAASQYVVSFVPTTTLTADTHTVTIQFPVGTTLPSSISASSIQFSDDGTDYTATGTAPVVDTDKRLLTATTSDTVTQTTETCYVKVLSTAGITNPTRASTTLYKTMVRTSVDGEYKVASSAHTISAGSPTAVTAANGQIGLSSTYYSDDATMINMYSNRIFLVLTDANGNAKSPASTVTVSLSTSSGSGAFYTNAEDDGSGAMSSASSVSLDAQTPDAGQTVYYKDAAAGTVTLTFTASGYTTATWTLTVCSGVSVYDSSNNLVNTYAPSSSTPAAETATTTVGASLRSKVGADYINDANDAAMAGDTVKLGDGIYEFDNDDVTYPWTGGGVGIQIDKKITLTSVNGASYTTLRNTEDVQAAVYVTGVDGTATYPIIIDGLTFQRLRSGLDIFRAVVVDGTDYVTVRNCIFNYIKPDSTVDACSLSDGSDTGVPGAVVDYIIYNAETHISGVTHDITSATVSNNTFNNCGTFGAETYGHEAMILMFSRRTGGEPLLGGVISGNTITNCNGRAICVKGNAAGLYVTASITNNTITNPYTGINMEAYVKATSVTGNTVTGSYKRGIWSESDGHNQLTIKNNTVTGTATSYAVYVEHDPDAFASESVYDYIQYNDISGNNSYAIYMGSNVAAADYTEIDCKYNWYGDATGPYYSALTGATVTKSNPNGAGDKISDRATYYPWLHKSKADVVTDNASYQACTMKLVSGWNTLSAPVKLIAAANSIDELIPSGMTIGYYYDGGWQQITTGYVLNPCDAVYAKMSAATYVLFKFDAGAFSTPSKSLATGWNLIGLAYLSSSGMDADDAVASVYKTAANLPGYSQVVSPSLNATQRDMYYTAGTSWSISSAQHATATGNSMYAGLGYWVYMQNAATLAGFEITPIAPDID